MFMAAMATSDFVAVDQGNLRSEISGSVATNDTIGTTSALAYGWGPASLSVSENGWYEFDAAGRMVYVTVQQSGYVTAAFTSSVTVITTEKGGSVYLNTDGTYKYVSANGFVGADSFQYGVYDSAGGSSTAVVNINVTPTEGANLAPIAVDDVYNLVAGQKLVGAASVLANDVDPNNPIGSENLGLTVKASTFLSANGGVVSLFASGQFNYTPKTGFIGQDSFTYTVTDPGGATSQATVRLFVGEPPNIAPVALADGFRGQHDAAISGNVLTNDTDPDGNAISVEAKTYATANGQIMIAADGTFTYIPKAGFVGTDTATYTLMDSRGGTATGTITFDLTNKGPVAINDEMRVFSSILSLKSADEGAVSAVAGNVLANDNDPDGDALKVDAGVFATAGGGSIEVFENGDFNYIPPANQTVADTFTYTVRDNAGGASTAVITFTPNKGPNAVNDNFTVARSSSLNGNVLLNDSDPENDALSVVAGTLTTTGGRNITLNQDGTFTFQSISTPSTDSFNYTVVDSFGATATATATIKTINAGPVANADGFVTGFGKPIIKNVLNNVLFNDVDPDGDALTAIAVSMATTQSGGTYSIDANGDFLYVPAVGFTGTDTISYFVNDGFGGMSSSVIRVTVEPPKNTTYGTVNGDTMNGTSADDTMFGRDGKDVLNGNDGNDMLFGDAGDDTIYGGNGADFIDGGAGVDKVYGGAGADKFVIRPGTGTSVDKIMDWAKEDQLVVSGSSIGLDPATKLDASYFSTVRSTAAMDHGRFFYDAANKSLFWDDGKVGTADVLLTTFNSKATIGLDDIELVA